VVDIFLPARKATMFSHYQHHPTSYGNLALASAHAIVDDLHARAAKLAPRFEDECADSGCTNLRPGDDQPRRQKVWDMVAEAHGWNLIADDVDAVVAAKLLAASDKPYQVGFAWNVTPGDRLSYQQPFVIDLNGGDLLTFQQVNAIEDTVARGTALIVLDAPESAQAPVECLCSHGHTVYGPTGRQVACDECGALFDEIPFQVGVGSIPLHNRPSQPTVSAQDSQEAEPFRCPECDTYSGTFSQEGDLVVHSTCGLERPVAAFHRSSPEFAAIYDHQEI
jgi:ribosomal protein S27E